MTDIQIDITERLDCRAGGGPLTDVLSLGHLHLSGFLKPGEAQPPQYPLTLSVGEQSGLVQLRHTVDANAMYRNYWYRSGTNDSMVNHLKALAQDAARRVHLNVGDVVLDIGCNDGTLLSAYPRGAWRIGFDPSNVFPVIGKHCEIFVNDYFRADLFPFKKMKARIVTSIAMFYDLDDPVWFADQVRQVLHDDGLWVVELHYLPLMLARNEFDAICHEHLAYYSLSSLEYVVHQAGLSVVDVSLNEVNGGSLRAYIRKAPIGYSGAFKAMALDELECPENFELFADRVGQNKLCTVDLLEKLRSKGKKVLGYGASTKGNTILQYYGITPDLLPAIADRNPAKHGLRTAGTHIPIVSEEEARAMKPDYFFVLPYHFLENFLKRESSFLASGGRFIAPLPEPRIVP